MKRVLLVLLVVAALVGVALYAARRYMQSERVATDVAARLEAVYGGEVQVGQVDVGLTGSSITEVKLFEKPAELTTASPAEPEPARAQQKPWLDIGKITTDVSAWALLRGVAVPKQVTLEGPSVALRFDRDGHLLTRFPWGASSEGGDIDLSQVPEVVLKGGQVTFSKEGRKDLVVEAVDARLQRQGDGFTLAGTGVSKELGKLVLSGAYDPKARTVDARLKTEGEAHVTHELLDRIPFVPAATWEEVRIEKGDTPAELSVRYDLDKWAFHYRVELAPRNTDLAIAAVRLAARVAHGKVTIDDNLVTLRGVEGQAFRGTVKLDADLDFRGDTTTLRFTNVTVKGADVAEFPASWKFPPQIRGRLTGSATLELVSQTEPFRPAAVGTAVGLVGPHGGFAFWRATSALAALRPQRALKLTGHGKGEVLGAKVAGLPAEELTVEWQGEQGFKVSDKAASILPAPELNGSVGCVRRTMWDVSPGDDVLQAGDVARGAFHAPYQFVSLQEPRDPEINVLVGRAVGEGLAGLRTIVRGVIDVGGEVFGRIPRKIDTKPGAAPSYVEVNLKLKQVSLAELVKNLNVKLAYPVDGKLSFQVKAAFPIDQPGDLKAYRFNGTAQVTDLVVADVRLAEADAEVTYAEGMLDLKSLKGRFAVPKDDAKPGAFNGTARMQVVPLGTLTADLDLDRVPLAELAEFGKGKLPLGGVVSGKLHAEAPAEKLKDLATWKADGTLTSDRLLAYGLALTDAAAALNVDKGVLVVSKLTGQLEGAPAAASGRVRLTGDYGYAVSLSLRDWNVAALQRLSPDVRPPVALAGAFSTSVDVKGTLKPFTSTASGDAQASELRIENFLVRSAKFHWAAMADRLLLDKLTAQLYGGEATGSATLPLDAKATGKIDLRVRNLDTRELARALPVPFRIEGNVDGELKGTLPPAADGKQRTAKLNLDLKAPKLRVQNIPTEQLRGSLEYDRGVVDYKLEGKTLGGTFELEGQIPGDAQPAAKPAREGRLTLRRLQLARLFDALSPRDAAPLTGVVNLDLTFRHNPKDRLPEGSGTLQVANLRWRGNLLANNVRTTVVIADGAVRLREVSGSIAGGQFRGQLAYNLTNAERSFFTMNLDNVEASQLLGPWLGDDAIEGPLQARIRGNLGATWSGTADVDMARGNVYGLEVTSWRLPISWQFSPGQNRGEIRIADTSAQVSRGRAVGKLNLAWDYTARLDGEVKFYGVDVQTLLRRTAGSTQLAGGTMTGRFDFEGRDVRSVDDVTGTFAASFSQAQALQLPVLQQVAPFLGIGPQTTFQKGSVLARLARGVIRVQHLTLEGGTYQVFAEGNISTQGRLNLDVIARTGDVGLPANRLRLLGLRIPVAGPVPLVAIQEASALLSNQAVYLQVTGTVRSPVIRPLPVPILTEAAVRYFVTRAVPFPVP